MISTKSGNQRIWFRLALGAALVLVAIGLASGAQPTQASGPIGAAGSWTMTVNVTSPGVISDTCAVTVTQTKTTVTQTSISCPTFGTGSGTLGTLDLSTGAYSETVTVTSIGTGTTVATLTGTVSKNGLTNSGTFTGTNTMFGIISGNYLSVKASTGNEWSISAGSGACDTNPLTVAPTTCSFTTGSTFTVQTSIDSISLPNNDADAKNGYLGLQARLNSSAGLPYTDRPFVTEVTGPAPPCDLAAEDASGAPTSYLGACVPTGNESLYTGPWMEVDYTCTSSGTVSLVHGIPLNTAIFDDGYNGVSNDSSGASENLAISCVTPPTDEEINVYIVDSIKGLPLSNGCVAVYEPTAAVFEYVSDNGAVPACDSAFPGPFSDGNPAVGTIAITITGSQRATYGDTWHVVQVLTQANFSLDLNQYTCNMSFGKCFQYMTNTWGGESNIHGEYNLVLFDYNTFYLDNCTVDISQVKGVPGTHPLTVTGTCFQVGAVTMSGTIGAGQINLTGSYPGCGTSTLSGSVGFNNSSATGTWNCGPFSGFFTLMTNDSDHDGCTDVAEQNTNPNTQNTGGLRNYLNPWDFYDVPTGIFPNYTKNRAVAAPDFNGVLSRFGASDAGGTAPVNRNSDRLTTPVPAAPAYHPAFDRGPSGGPGNWNLTAADGAIASPDFNRVLQQFGHNCN